jgi:hypothetical protein
MPPERSVTAQWRPLHRAPLGLIIRSLDEPSAPVRGAEDRFFAKSTALFGACVAFGEA